MAVDAGADVLGLNSPLSRSAHAARELHAPRGRAAPRPAASACVLPCSAEIASASWPARSHRIILNRSRMRARFSGDAFAQAGHAARGSGNRRIDLRGRCQRHLHVA